MTIDRLAHTQLEGEAFLLVWKKICDYKVR